MEDASSLYVWATLLRAHVPPDILLHFRYRCRHIRTFGSSRLQYRWKQPALKVIEILSGGPARDGIPALDNPSFLNVSDEDRLLIANHYTELCGSCQRPSGSAI
jgi:hypothetical protein